MPRRLKKSRSGGAAASPSAVGGAGGLPVAGIDDFGQVYREFLRPVHAFVAYRIGHRQAAEDLTAQIFEKAWRARSGFNPARAEVSAWIFTIARNSIIDHYRSRAREPQVTDEVEAAAGREADPAQELEALELRRELAAALKTLDEREHEIVSLKFGARMNNRRIAQLLGISESNVGTILFRSLKKLKTRLEGGSEND